MKDAIGKVSIGILLPNMTTVLSTSDYSCDQSCKFDHDMTKQHLLYHLKNNIATKITSEQAALLPSRRDFLDSKIAGAFRAQVVKKGPILFMPNDIVEKFEYVGGDQVYKVYMFGILPCGSKTLVILDDVEVYFDIRVPKHMSVAQYDDLLRGQLTTRRLLFTNLADTTLSPMHGFYKLPVPYKRIYFNNLADRKEALKWLEEENLSLAADRKLETASDDLAYENYYFPKVARESSFNTAGWNRFTKYTSVEPSKFTTNCAYVFRVSVRDFLKLDKKTRAQYAAPANPMKDLIDKDNMMVMSWDIETYSTNENGQIPSPETHDWNIFMVNTLYFWRASTVAMYGVCCVDVDTGIHPKTPLTIVCGTQRKVLEMHFLAMSLLAPDLSVAFNGSHFDWHNVREILRREKMLVKVKQMLSSIKPISGKFADTESSVNRFSFRNSINVKIDAENNHEMKTIAVFPGCVDTDLMPVFLKLYPRNEVRKAASLNYFLAANGLDGKEDMPYSTMFRIYERAKQLADITECHCNKLSMQQCTCCTTHVHCIDFTTNGVLHPELCNDDGTLKCCFCGKKPRNLKDMADVGYYCIIDCQRPQELYVKRTIIADKRELSTMSYVTLYDSFYRADGMKVRNLMGKYCHKRKTAFSNAKSNKDMSEKDHYPGAHVFPPNRGLHSDGLIEVSIYDINGNVIKLRKRARPIFGDDFNSLYPSLMMAYNISPDTLIYDEETAKMLADEGYSIYKIEPFKYEKGRKKGDLGNKQLTTTGWTVRHNGIVNKKCTNIVTSYTKYETFTAIDSATPDAKPTVIKRKCDEITSQDIIDQLSALDTVKVSRKPSYEPNYGRAALQGEQMGLFPFIVKKIFDKRVPVKAEYVRWELILAAMDLNKQTESQIETKLPSGETVVSTISYADAVFQMKKADSTQKALKVLANTFYGESGNFLSSVYELLVAAGITCAGQYNIKLVAAFVTKLGYTVHYGDTDSVYLSAPDELFAECDAEYDTECERIAKLDISAEEKLKLSDAARIVWWTKQVEISKVAAARSTELITDYLLSDNGTLYLKMAYEEVLFPTVFTGKKKYYGTAHIEDVNFFPKKPFIRGIDIIKQGQAEISKMLGMEFIKESLSPYNHRELIDIAIDKIRKFYTTTIDPQLFKLIGRFKSMIVQNIPVRTFVTRMRTMQQKYCDNEKLKVLYDPPEAGDKFEYIIVKKDAAYTLSGKKIPIKKGDQMEFLRVFIALQGTDQAFDIDLSYYMKNSIVGLFARFIAYHSDFQPVGPVNLLDKVEYKKMDQFCVNAADAYLNQLCDSITGYNPDHLKQEALDFKAVYKRVDKQIKNDLACRYGGTSNLFLIDIRTEDGTKALSTRIINTLVADAKNSALAAAQTYGAEYLAFNAANAKLSNYKLGICYTEISRARLRFCKVEEQRTLDELWKNIHSAADTMLRFERNMIDIVTSARRKPHEELADEELAVFHDTIDSNIDTMNLVQRLFIDLCAIYRVQSNTMSILSAVKQEKVRCGNAF